MLWTEMNAGTLEFLARVVREKVDRGYLLFYVETHGQEDVPCIGACSECPCDAPNLQYLIEGVDELRGELHRLLSHTYPKALAVTTATTTAADQLRNEGWTIVAPLDGLHDVRVVVHG